MTKITPEHLARIACVYIRQSTPDQLLHNQESQRRQYGLADRARALGWSSVEVIDDDLGRSGGGSSRPGFERLLSAICDGRVGAVFAIEASRLARNGRDWHTLIEFCGLEWHMRIGLFIPCYIDAFFPEVGIATLELLERFGHAVVYPRDQTCCGQPMANSGFNADCAATEALFVRNFSGFDYVVAPSGSCVHHVRNNLDAIEQTADVKEVRSRTYELVEFLHDIQKVDAFPWARFPHRVGLHNSCGTLRQLKHARPSELHEPFFSKPMDLLTKVAGIEFVTPARPDECCGFGGTFSVFEEVVSTKMGYDKVSDHARAGAEYIVSADTSCLMHQKGCAERIGVPIKFIHIAEILNGADA